MKVVQTTFPYFLTKHEPSLQIDLIAFNVLTGGRKADDHGFYRSHQIK